MGRTIHIIGAGLAGLSAAVRLAQSSATVVVHEATRQAGGRCRSYADAATGLTIDNGNHLLLSGNHAALDYLKAIGSDSHLVGPAGADFPFVDLATGGRWTIRMSDGRIPWWIFDATRRAPGTSPRDYLAMARLLWAPGGSTVCDLLPCEGLLYERLLHPLLLAALNIDPHEGSAALAGAVVRETLAAGGRACRPLVARFGLGSAFIEPALDFLRARNAVVHFEHELRGMTLEPGGGMGLDFGNDKVPVGRDDAIIVAVPPYAARSLIPGLDPPSTFRAIVNAHFRVEPPATIPHMIGVLNGTVEWIFAFPNRLSVTISAADRFMDAPREALARTIWAEVSRIAALPPALPPWQIVRERRATFAATPAENAKRPPAQTAWRNVFLAGDWTATGLPATIEGAIRSGHRAAQCVMQT
jgi:squalene-associated FAD-dependent desaturase